MVLIAVTCPYCQSDHIAKRGKTETGKPRYRCHNPNCSHQSFLLNPAYKGRLPEIKEQIIDMALTGNGIRDTAQHQPGNRNTQKIERQHLTLRTRIKRLTRKTICFSKSIQMHDIVIGLFVNRYEFGWQL